MQTEQVWAAALSGADCRVRSAAGRARPFPVARFVGEATRDDEAVLARAAGPVLDVGCGPGRIAAALAARGVPALGLDVSPAAVALTRARGAEALCRSVFAPLPGEGAWATVLLLDGNVGIGGAPVPLLRRAARLLAPRGRVVVETGPPEAHAGVMRLRLEAGGLVGEWFAWGHVGGRGLAATAAAAGLRVIERFASGGRCFATLAA